MSEEYYKKSLYDRPVTVTISKTEDDHQYTAVAPQISGHPMADLDILIYGVAMVAETLSRHYSGHDDEIKNMLYVKLEQALEAVKTASVINTEEQ